MVREVRSGEMPFLLSSAVASRHAKSAAKGSIISQQALSIRGKPRFVGTLCHISRFSGDFATAEPSL